MSIRDQVLAFHEAAGQPVRTKPSIPDDRAMRRRLRLVTEEYFELLRAFGLTVGHHETEVTNTINEMDLFPDLTGIADACGDLDYVVEGTRQELGINGEPIAAEIHRSNMAKFGPGSHKREDGKVLKPPGWTPPDIEGELRKQGWGE